MLPYTQLPPFYSQWGEDRWLAEHLHLPEAGAFVDVGAGDGVRGSNSLYFENLGWRGVCVDADPRNHERLGQRTCAIETCAVASLRGIRPFGMYAHKPSWSGLDRQGTDYQQVPVLCRTLEELLRQHDIDQIDLLSIDVEGTELDVWDSFEPALHRPSIVIVEFDDQRPERHRDAILAHLSTDTYRLVHETPANLILRRTDRSWPRRR